jgi:hypothetical protein
MSDETLPDYIDYDHGDPIDLDTITSIGNPTTVLNGVLQTSSQPSITTLANIASLGTVANLPNGNMSINANVDKAELYVYNSEVLPTYKSGIRVSQLANTADAHLQYNAYGTKSTLGIDQSDGYKLKISKSQSLDANPIVTIDPNYVASATAVTTWTIRNSAANNTWVSICWSPELRLFCAVSITGTGNRVMTSSDSITWTSRTTTGFDNSWQSVCWSPELRLFVAVSSDGVGNRVMTSSDDNGSRTSAVDNQWRSVCWSSELRLFCAVAASGTGNRVMTSPNGITWTSRTSAVDNNWYGVCWSPDLRLFCAVALSGTGNRVMTSPNGINWTSRTSAADNNWRSICWSPDLRLFCVVGQAEQAIAS